MLTNKARVELPQIDPRTHLHNVIDASSVGGGCVGIGGGGCEVTIVLCRICHSRFTSSFLDAAPMMVELVFWQWRVRLGAAVMAARLRVLKNEQGKKVFKSYCLPCDLFWFPRGATKCNLVATRRELHCSLVNCLRWRKAVKIHLLPMPKGSWDLASRQINTFYQEKETQKNNFGTLPCLWRHCQSHDSKESRRWETRERAGRSSLAEHIDGDLLKRNRNEIRKWWNMHALCTI